MASDPRTPRATTRVLAGTAVEIVEDPPRGSGIRHAVFDLDGTLSLLRDGWQDQMVPLLVEALEACPEHEPRAELEALVIDFVDHLTGKQTIYQMIRLAEEVEKRGGRPLDPVDYKQRYNERLAAAIAARIDGLESRTLRAETLLVPGSVAFLQRLVARGVRCYLASGTDDDLVRRDAELLGFAALFEGGIFGALPDYQRFSKAKVIRGILSEFELSGPELLIVGDGYVEIENAREVGAIAFGVHTRENNRYHMNAGKRERLLRAGAHLLAADLRAGDAVIEYLGV